MVLVVNEGLSDNLGDQLIAEATKSLFAEVFIADYSWFVKTDELRPIVKDSESGKKEKEHSLSRVLIGKLILALKFWKIYRNEDFKAVVIGGGQLLLSNNVFPVNLILWSLFARAKKVPLHILSVGLNEKTTLLQRRFITVALRRAKTVSVRDEESRNILLRDYGVVADVIPDLVYLLSIPKVKRSVKPRTFICPVDYNVYLTYKDEADFQVNSFREYLKYWCDLVLHEAKCSEVVIGATTQSDSKIARVISSMTDCPFLDCTSHQAFLNEVRESNRVIGGRMHALIMAHIECVEAVPVKLSRKIISFNNEYLCEPNPLVIRRILINHLNTYFEESLLNYN